MHAPFLAIVRPWLRCLDYLLPIRGFSIQKDSVDMFLIQPLILAISMKWVPGVLRNLVVKGNLIHYSGFTAFMEVN